MQINSLATDIETIFHETNFLVTMESHLTHLRSSANIRLLPISKHQSYKYEGDLYGLLDDLRVEKKYHYIVMRLNNFDTSNQFKGDIEHIAIPDLNEIEILKNILQTE